MSDSVFSSPSAGFRADDLGTPSVEVATPAVEVALVTLVGEHDLSTKPLLLDALARASEQPCIVVDLTLCPFVDSSVLGALVALHGVGLSRIKLVVPDAQRIVRRTFELAGMAAFFPLYDSLEEALTGTDDSPDQDALNVGHVRMVVYAGAGIWKVQEPGGKRASAREDSREKAEDRGREILRNLGGGELRVFDVDGAVLDVHVVPSPDAARASRTYRSPRGTYGLG